MQKSSLISNQHNEQKAISLFSKKTPYFFEPFIQAKPAISHPADIYEQEANAVAERVMRMSALVTQPVFFSPKTFPSTPVQRKCAHCEEEEKKVQMKKGTVVGGVIAPPVVNSVINSIGQPLDAGTRNFMESRFGYDFGNVQVHDDLLAHQSSGEINALAYTHGNHVVFGEGQYRPASNTGKHLLAHELVHVIQQNRTERFPGKDITTSIQKQDRDTQKCTQPTAVALDSSRTVTMAYPDFLTGANFAGICALMKAFPENKDLCPDSIQEEVKPGKGTTCPDTLIKDACSGDSVFSPGRKQKLCKNEISSTEFTDRHSIQVESISILHDKTRNPKKLKSCKFVCDQKYFAPGSKDILGNFQVIYEITKAKHDNKDVTDVKAVKKQIK